MSRKILKVKDKNDSYYKKMDNYLWDLPLRLLIVGKSQNSCGKTSIILNLLLRKEFYAGMWKSENIFIISNNKLDNKLAILAKQLDIPSENIMKYDEDDVTDIYEQLEEEFIEATQQKKKPNHSLILFDDCGYTNSLKNKEAGIITRLISNGRHALISQIYSIQSFKMASTTLRRQVNGAILASCPAKELDMISDEYSYCEKKTDFIKQFRKATEKPYSFFAINFTNGGIKDGLYLDSAFKPIKID